jgi:hypothetical protein
MDLAHRVDILVPDLCCNLRDKREREMERDREKEIDTERDGERQREREAAKEKESEWKTALMNPRSE